MRFLNFHPTGPLLAPEGADGGGGGAGPAESAEPATGEGGDGSGEGARKGAEEPPAWARPLLGLADKMATYEKRIADQGRQIAKLKGVPAKEDDQPRKGAGDRERSADTLTRTEAQAMRRYERTRGNLTKEQNQRLDQLEEDGWTFDQLAVVASEIAAFGQADKADSSNEGPSNGTRSPGYGATPPASPPAKKRPKSMSELQALMDKDPREYERLWNDPSFDPDTLPRW